jgi:O-antigen/teichoic acid export membrane protein
MITQFVSSLMDGGWRSSRQWAVLFGWAGTALNAIGQLVIPALVVRVLGDESLGLWQYILSLFFLSLLAEMGISQGVIRVLAEYKDDPKSYSVAYRAAVRPLWFISGLVVIACLSLTVFGFLSGSVEPGQSDEFLFSMSVFCVWAVVKNRLSLSLHGLMAKGLVGSYSLVHALISLSRPLLAVVFLLVSESILLMVLAYVLAEMCFLLLSFRIHGAVLAHRGNDELRPIARRVLGFGFGNGFQMVAAQSANYLQPVMIGAILGLTYVPAFVSSVMLSILGHRFILPALSPWYPLLIKWGEERRSSVLPEGLFRYLIICLIFSGVGSVFLFFVNPWFVGVWVGSQFHVGVVFDAFVALQLPLYVVNELGSIVMRAYARSSGVLVKFAAVESVVMLAFSVVGLALGGLLACLGAITVVRVVRALAAWLIVWRLASPDPS